MRKRDLFYQELRKQAEAMHSCPEKDAMDTETLMNVSETLCWICEETRNEGLLWMGRADGKIPDHDTSAMEDCNRIRSLPMSSELCIMMDLTCDGTEPDILEELFITRYFAKNFSGKEGFLYLLYMDVMLDIRLCEHPRLVMERICAYMPDEVGLELNRKWEARLPESVRRLFD